MSDVSESWYMRARGRVLGPFTLAEIVSFRDRGQLSQFHEVSRDRRSWTTAAQVPELFAGNLGLVPGGVAPEADPLVYGVVEAAGPTPRGPAVDASPGWFYAQGSQHTGPIPLVELQRLVDSGVVGPATLVWRGGLPDWLPAHQVPDLRFPGPMIPPGSAVGPLPQQALVASGQPYIPRVSGLAIASLVLGLLWLCGLGSLLATIFGAVALTQISRAHGTISGRGMAIAGLVLGIIGLSGYAVLFAMGHLGALLH